MKSKFCYSINDIQSNSESEIDTLQNSFQTNEEEKSPKKINKNKRTQTPLKLNLNFKDPKIIDFMKKVQNYKEPLDGIYKYIINSQNGMLKDASGKRFLKNEIEPINSHLILSQNGRKRRSNSISSTACNRFFLIQNILPITVKVINLPKNLSLKEIKKQIDANIDDKTFLCLKYNKKYGILYIKFRNELYYNYYSFYFKGRYFYTNKYNPKMIDIKENANLWTSNQNEEILNFYFNNRKPDNFYYKSYIKKNFRFCTKSRFLNYFNNY
jgi:hypothetical protein